MHTPIATGCIPHRHPRNMGVGGSKGSLPGNYAMENADLLIAIGTRAVCQSDCSRTGYPQVKQVININADLEDALHYHHTLPLVGDVQLTLEKLNNALGKTSRKKPEWLHAGAGKKAAWQAFKQERVGTSGFTRRILGRRGTQPAGCHHDRDPMGKEEQNHLFLRCRGCASQRLPGGGG